MQVKYLAIGVIGLSICAIEGPAQAPAGGRGGRGGAPAAGFVRPQAYPDRPPANPEALARGKAIYGIQCNFCHGSDARGGEGGPNLLRSDLVLNDQHGERIAEVVLNGRGEMPKISLTKEQLSDVADYIHSFKVAGYDPSRNPPPSILVGDAKEGEQAFQRLCASCHSVTGDLKGIASKVPDPKTLQNGWIMPAGGRGGRGPFTVTPVTVTVTAGSAKTEGRLVRIDDFIVTLTDSDGAQRSFRRDGDVPKVEIHDPMDAHRNLLPKYTDKDIHNITSYLVTIK